MFSSCCRSKIVYSTPQDQHLAYFAGEKGGESPIAKIDRINALNAQPHPIGNKCKALGTQMLPSIAYSAFAMTAYLLSDAKILASIFGKDICAPCSMNKLQFADGRGFVLNQATDLWNQASDATSGYLNGRQTAVWNYTANLWNQASNFTSGYISEEQRGALCSHAENLWNQTSGIASNFADQVTNAELCEKGEIVSRVSCGLTNYLGNAVRTAAQSPFALAAGFGLILGWKAMRHLERSMAKETAAEQTLIDQLQKKYQDAAERLKDRAFGSEPYESGKAKELALAILQRQGLINQEIVDLHLPAVSTTKKANEITKSLFSAARAVADLQLTEEPVSPQMEEAAEPANKEESPTAAKSVEVDDVDEEVDTDAPLSKNQIERSQDIV